MPDRTLLDLYRHETRAPREAHYTHFTPGGKRSLSTLEFQERTAAIASWLERRGCGRGDRVMILSDNRPEWHMVDLAVLSLGAVDIPLYTTLTPAQIAYQAKDSGAIVAVAENAERMAKILETRDECPAIEHLVQMEGEAAEGVILFEEILEEGTPEDVADFWNRASSVGGEDLATIVYTSGTTGDPKGVMLTHENFVQNVLVGVTRAPVGPDDVVLEYLPLSHVFERCVGYAYMLRACTKAYCSVWHVADLVGDIRPTAFVSVPRFFEKVHARIMGKVAESSALRRALFGWAIEVGKEHSRCRLEGRKPGAVLALRHRVADGLVLSRIRQAFGGRLRYTMCGGAALPVFLNEFFHALGIPVHEGYGLTETSPAIATCGWEAGTNRLGSVGRPMENLEVKLAKDGELLVKGPSVMKGYWNKPEKTAEVFDEEGFFRTGDIATVDEDGFIYITDRKKDLIVTAGGKNVAPQPIESEMARSRFIDNTVLIGDGRPYIVALISPQLDELESWARAEGVAFEDREELAGKAEVEQLLDRVVQTVNLDHAPFEQVKKFRVLPLELTVENGYLTPTMKIKRRAIESDWSDLIDGMYG